MLFVFQMRFMIDRVFRDIYARVMESRPDIREEIGDPFHPENLKLTLDMFPCYRSILDKISENCFSLPRVRVYIFMYGSFI